MEGSLMSRLEIKFKQVLTTLLALAMLLAMAPILPGGLAYAAEWGNTSAEEWGVSISTDKAVYTEGEDIRYTIPDFSSSSHRAFETDELWLGLYEYGASDGYTTSIKWEYINSDIEDNSLQEDLGYTLAPGKYHLIVTTGAAGNDTDSIWATLDFSVKERTVWRNTSAEEWGVSISTDKDVYDEGEDVRYTIPDFSSSSHRAFGTDELWLGLYEYGASDGYQTSIKWEYINNDIEDNSLQEDLGYTLAPGKYHLIVTTGNAGNDAGSIWATLDFTVGEYIEPEISLDKEGSIPQYKYGEPVMLTAQGSDSSAWFGVYDYSGQPFPDGYYARFNIKDVTESIDLVQAAADTGKPLKYGEKYRIYLCINENGNPNSIQFDKSLKFELVDVFGDPTWDWDDDYTTATATFTSKSDSAATKTVEVKGDGITSEVTKEATEDEEGIKTHTATITADMIDFTTENDPPFTDSAEEVIPKLSHVHDISPVDANDPTCTKPGNITYYICSGCNKYFSDADGTEEIEDKSSVTIKALGHDWSDWKKDQATYDDKNATKTHTRVCKRERCGVKETENCTSELNKELYVCKFCGGQYEQMTVPVITTDKEEYKVGEEILVTTEMNGYSGERGWVALYQRGAAYQTSLYWFYPDCFDKSRPLLPTGSINTDNENYGSEAVKEELKNGLPAGEYELVYLTYPENPYQLVGHPTYFSVVKDIESEEITKDPECTKPGNKHIKYKDGTEEDVEIPALGHDPKEEWVFDGEKRVHYHACSRCDEKLDKAACTFDEGKVTKEPTVKEEGEKTYTCTVCGGTYTEAIPTLVESGVKRVYGSTRYQTAILQANELKALLKVDKFDAVIVATGENFADALSGAYLGYVKKAPILLVNSKSVNEVKDYIKNNLASGGTIYLLGGPTVVPNDVTAGLSGFTPKRLYGKTRYETNIEILKEAGVKGEELMICDGNNFADSLSASAAQRPIFLVNKSLNKAQRAYLDTLRTRKYYLIGGTGVLPTALENDINTNFGSTIRLGGKDRYDTSVKVAKNKDLFNSPSKAVLAYGRNYPDGLCGGPLAAYMDAPLLLVQDASAATIKGYTSPKGIKSGIVLGGPSLIADKSARSIFGLNETDEIYVVNK